MFKRSERLKRADFSRIKSKGLRHGEFFTLASSLPGEKAQFACVVSKKVSPKATERNLIKRRCRAAIRAMRPAGTKALVFTAKRSVLGATYQEILSDVRRLVLALD